MFGPGDGPRRYSDLRDRIGGISKKMLNRMLRKLERNRLVERRVLATAPAGAEYRLTELGQSLLARSPSLPGGRRTTNPWPT
ncbi:winged helix-turn-helix transcriptional regulator [Allokutzneria albata]|uniref:winged helix-turn-helix transcriptional regulator n=1 Tax=Allokutzneria albata TaxID=211114 RepID=UPI0006933968|nr:helix-turn-helix domain-containing protein [Allokutzneria albata]